MNNREIKFRAWDESRNEMISQFGLLKENMPQLIQHEEDGYIFCGHSQENDDWCEPILMQYTGLKDKNGKEIYEGDILSGHSDGNVRVEWSNANGGWDCIFSDEANISISEMCSWFGNNAQVIGNIYENPELLNK